MNYPSSTKPISLKSPCDLTSQTCKYRKTKRKDNQVLYSFSMPNQSNLRSVEEYNHGSKCHRQVHHCWLLWFSLMSSISLIACAPPSMMTVDSESPEVPSCCWFWLASLNIDAPASGLLKLLPWFWNWSLSSNCYPALYLSWSIPCLWSCSFANSASRAALCSACKSSTNSICYYTDFGTMISLLLPNLKSP